MCGAFWSNGLNTLFLVNLAVIHRLASDLAMAGWCGSTRTYSIDHSPEVWLVSKGYRSQSAQRLSKFKVAWNFDDHPLHHDGGFFGIACFYRSKKWIQPQIFQSSVESVWIHNFLLLERPDFTTRSLEESAQINSGIASSRLDQAYLIQNEPGHSAPNRSPGRGRASSTARWVMQY